MAVKIRKRPEDVAKEISDVFRADNPDVVEFRTDSRLDYVSLSKMLADEPYNYQVKTEVAFSDDSTQRSYFLHVSRRVKNA